MLITSNTSEIAQIIRNGGVVAYPTEAVWGLGCDPYNELAVQRILALKSRPVEKGLILVVGSADQLSPWQPTLTPEQFERLTSKTDHPTSWVVPDQTITPEWVRGAHQSVAIRLSLHHPVEALCQAYQGAIVSTSANPSGLEPAKSKDEVIAYFNEKIDAIYDESLGTQSKPSHVLDLITGQQFRA